MKYLDENGLLYYTQKIKTWLSNKVDKVEGKGLSTNDYTTTEKNKLAGIEAQANKTTVDSSMSASSTNPVQNKIVKSYVDNAISGITGFDFQIVSSLPSTGVKGTIYLVAHSHGTGDIYDEYIWITNKFEKIGSTDIDLSNYATKTYVDEAIEPVEDDIDDITERCDDLEGSISDISDGLGLKVNYTDLVAITSSEIDTICS